MTTRVAVRERTVLARPLKTLVPLIKADLHQGDMAGLEHYRRAGEKLLEAREQLSGGSWTAWLKRNFELSRATAARYMRLAHIVENGHVVSRGETTSLGKAIGEAHTPSSRDARGGESWRRLYDYAAKIKVDDAVSVRQARDEEIRLHRELAVELVNAGYRLMATKLHPDRGGSKDAMRRLNRVRNELLAVAESRRFE